LLSDGKRSQKDGNNPVLTERETVVGMPGYLQDEIPVPPLEEKLTRRRPANWKTAENKWTRTESEILLAPFPLNPDQFDSVELPQRMPGDFQPKIGSRFRKGQQSGRRMIWQKSSRLLAKEDTLPASEGIADEAASYLTAGTEQSDGTYKWTRLPNFCPIASEWGDFGLLFVG
jgi:hypothetical protein